MTATQSPKPTVPRRRPAKGPPQPAARFVPGSVGDPRHRNPLWLAGGLLLVVLCGLGGVLLFASADDRTKVVVAAHDLQPGAPITREDMRIVEMAVADGVASVSPSDATQLVGLLAVGRVPDGTLLNPAMFAASVPLGADEMVVGAALDPGESPLSHLDVGTDVELLFAPQAAAGGAVAAGAPLPPCRSGAASSGPRSRWPADRCGWQCACPPGSVAPPPRRRRTTACGSRS